jgi:hypothetical protein
VLKDGKRAKMKEVKKESDSALGAVVESDFDSKIFLPVELLHPHKLGGGVSSLLSTSPAPLGGRSPGQSI